MKLLLDTHVWLWNLLEPSKLSHRVARTLEDETNELWLSPLSVWETALIAQKGRISLAPTVKEWITASLEKVPMKEAPVTFDVAQATEEIRLSHRDPVDQLLAATARAFDLTLVTADARLLRGTGFRTLANR